MGSRSVKVSIQVVLALVIVVLGYWLFESITGPWRAQQRTAALTEMTRERMTNVRTALVYYERQEDNFPGTLDSLMLWLSQDSLTQAATDSLFETPGFVLDSLLFSPRTGAMFEYTLNDTGRVDIYLLKDPDSDDQIGAATPDDVTQLNAASWE